MPTHTDILLCINTGEKKSTPTNKDFSDDDSAGPKNRRFAFYNDQFYFKTTEEMSKLFHDLPQAIDNTNEIVDKVQLLDLKRDILLPNFPHSKRVYYTGPVPAPYHLRRRQEPVHGNDSRY